MERKGTKRRLAHKNDKKRWFLINMRCFSFIFVMLDACVCSQVNCWFIFFFRFLIDIAHLLFPLSASLPPTPAASNPLSLPLTHFLSIYHYFSLSLSLPLPPSPSISIFFHSLSLSLSSVTSLHFPFLALTHTPSPSSSLSFFISQSLLQYS